MPLRPKKHISQNQRSILDFTKILKNEERKNESNLTEVIDLTEKEETTSVKIGKRVVIESTEESLNVEVSCPVCEKDISNEGIEVRISHVERCLLLLTLNEKRNKSEKDESNKRQKFGSSAVKEKASYINKKLKISEELSSRVLPLKVITPSKRKSPIPEVKILKFPISDTESYSLSVDAFNYAPHHSISKYFLTHFHSDHYGGISKKWCYERLFKENDDLENEKLFKKIIFCTKITQRLLSLKFKVDARFIKVLEFDKRYLIERFDGIILEDGGIESNEENPGLYVIPITANHCPGSAIFLFESIREDGNSHKILHCGDFRVNREILFHSRIYPYCIEKEAYAQLDKVYLDTTYMKSEYNFPKQELVCDEISNMFLELIKGNDEDSLYSTWFGILKQTRITDFLCANQKKKKKFLILVGTYLIGKENLAISISKKLHCSIYASNINSRIDKLDILKSFNDAYLDQVLTDNEFGNRNSECVIHLVPMKIVSSTNELSNYFNHNKYFEKFERCVGLRPTGWSHSRKEENILQDVKFATSNLNDIELNTLGLCEVMRVQPKFSFYSDILPQSKLRNSMKKGKKGPDEALYKIYNLPYSEHSSYRELSYFSIFLNIKQIIPTVNIGNEYSLKEMNEIIKLWEKIRSIKLHEANSTLNKELANLLENLSLNNF